MRKFGRLDSNQKQIVKRLRELPGVSVFSTASIGNGFPDLVVARNKTNYLIELKNGKEPLTQSEAKFFSAWKGQVCICRTFDDVLQTIGIDE